jgi:hypothetical protein
MANKRKNWVLIAGLVLVGAAIVWADEQVISLTPPTNVPKPKLGSDELEFAATVGSFKLLGSDEAPATGTLKINFDGTVLISGRKGQINTSGNVRQEYVNKEFEKEAYFGKGSLTLSGEVRSVQFFGRDLSGTFKGRALMRLFGEFDKNLDTGWIAYKGQKRDPWGTGGNVRVVPQQIFENKSSDLKVKDSE